MKSIEADRLSIGFGPERNKTNVLLDVSFRVEPGECFGLVGESGSGKSTVLRCVSRLLDVWSGEVRFGDVPVRGIDRKALCRMVQMVFQDPYGSLHPRHSVRTVLSEPLRIHDKTQNMSERMETALVDVGLPTSFLDRYPHELSGGQRQRVAIARALILDPEVILLDEPTSALDVSVQAEILNLLVKLRQQRGLTYLMVSHDLAVVDHMCDRLAVMQHGRIVEILDRSALQDNRASDPYARELIGASLAYDRASDAAS